MTSREQDPWKQLLNMSTGLTAQSGASGPLPNDIPKGDLEFLQKALIGEHLAEGPSMMEQFFNYKNNFDTEKFLEEPKRIQAAKDLADQLEDFFVMGNYADQLTNEDGIKALVNLTFHTNPEIQLQYLRLIPLIAENNGPIQSTIAHSSLFPSFLTELSAFSKIKPANLMALIAAISSICRGGGRAVWKKFVDLGGMEKVFEVIEGVEDAKSGGKAAHLFYSIHTSSDREDLEPHRETLEEYLKKTNEELTKRQGKKGNESKEANDFVEETRKKISQLITTFKKEDPKQQKEEDKKKKKTEKPLMLK